MAAPASTDESAGMTDGGPAGGARAPSSARVRLDRAGAFSVLARHVGRSYCPIFTEPHRRPRRFDSRVDGGEQRGAQFVEVYLVSKPSSGVNSMLHVLVIDGLGT
jgi:hypothetical protein